ncbi:hypothetical protein [Shinella sp. CPCC 101442]|uniref:hypothetical protein n=1 Tax=Shinella sp. CPCC 101442 TaxID=2932265 RepID=UPI0027E3B47A|nr:hypothetical protein [Shinella sp. CPCC 101442]
MADERSPLMGKFHPEISFFQPIADFNPAQNLHAASAARNLAVAQPCSDSCRAKAIFWYHDMLVKKGGCFTVALHLERQRLPKCRRVVLAVEAGYSGCHGRQLGSRITSMSRRWMLANPFLDHEKADLDVSAEVDWKISVRPASQRNSAPVRATVPFWRRCSKNQQTKQIAGYARVQIGASYRGDTRAAEDGYLIPDFPCV